MIVYPLTIVATFALTLVAIMMTTIAIPRLHSEGWRPVMFSVVSLLPLYPGFALAVEVYEVYWPRYPDRPVVPMPEGLTTMPLAFWAMFLGPIVFVLTRLIAPRATWSRRLFKVRQAHVLAFIVGEFHMLIWGLLI